jgi:hypothetical protein
VPYLYRSSRERSRQTLKVALHPGAVRGASLRTNASLANLAIRHRAPGARHPA